MSANRFDVSMNNLKLIAIIAMTLTHTAFWFLPMGSASWAVCHGIGQLTAPIMFYAAVQGYHHIRDLKKYFIRLIIFALVSQVPIAFWLNGGSFPANIAEYFSLVNVIYVIVLGLLAIYIRRKMRNRILKWLLIVALCFAASPGDWGVAGVVIILLFDMFYGSFKKQAVAYCIFAFIYGGFASILVDLVTLNFSDWDYNDFTSLGLFIPIILLGFYRGRRGAVTGAAGKIFKWLFYVFYPLHFIVIGVLYALLG